MGGWVGPDLRGLRCAPCHELYPFGAKAPGSRQAPAYATENEYDALALALTDLLILGSYRHICGLGYHYITPGILRNIAEALLAVFLWCLVLLGVDLHIGK